MILYSHSIEETERKIIMTKIINLTPHVINVVREDGTKIEIKPSGVIPRVSVKTVPAGEVNGIPLFRNEYGEVVDLPPAEDGVLLVVSGLLKSACPERTDLVVPARQIRDEAGRIIGCEGLAF